MCLPASLLHLSSLPAYFTRCLDSLVSPYIPSYLPTYLFAGFGFSLPWLFSYLPPWLPPFLLHLSADPALFLRCLSYLSFHTYLTTYPDTPFCLPALPVNCLFKCQDPLLIPAHPATLHICLPSVCFTYECLACFQTHQLFTSLILI